MGGTTRRVRFPLANRCRRSDFPGTPQGLSEGCGAPVQTRTMADSRIVDARQTAVGDRSRSVRELLPCSVEPADVRRAFLIRLFLFFGA